MKRYDLITPEGTRDLLFEGCLARRMVEDRLSKLFEGFGYSEVVTPGIEFYDLFMGSSRNFQQESLYKLTDSKGRLIVMRPDSTIPIARLASTRLKGAKLPLRLYYNQSIFENNSLLKGRSDEVVQAGIELIGGAHSLATVCRPAPQRWARGDVTQSFSLRSKLWRPPLRQGAGKAHSTALCALHPQHLMLRT